ncbi:MAG: hypothetical protein U9R02_11040 [Thermodesulfobacteriota bacterium]|nr:hypothetical protein [Thermodesulfobacteriota bacterium]
MAEGISKFKEEYPALAKKVHIVVYPGIHAETRTEAPDLFDSDVIFIFHLDYKVMLDLEDDLRIAMAKGVRVIGLGEHDVFRVKGYYNVDINDYPQIDAYWHGCNIKK